MTDDLHVAVVGAGGWGRGLVRHFATAERSYLRWICDRDEATRTRLTRQYATARPTADLEDVLDDPGVDAVVIATPPDSHHAIARRALEAGKHVYVEKPMTLCALDAADLTRTARRVDRKLMVGHLLEYHPAVRHLKRLVDHDELGDIHYLYAQRVNLGVVRSAENAWWSLAPHDLSVIGYLFGAEPTRVTLTGQCFLQPGVEDVVFATLDFADGRLAHVHVSWLDPHKIRKLTVVGSKRMATFDDMEATEKVRIYDKGATVRHAVTDYAEAVQLRTGEIVIPRIMPAEPLRLEVRHFIDAVLDDTPILSDGGDGERVVRILEAGSRSLRSGGKPAEVAPDDVDTGASPAIRLGAGPRRVVARADAARHRVGPNPNHPVCSER
jgi:predicted dehydrogenase